ncbi:MAG: hypothetical protein GY847_31755 [Proteobacteria bacterium]|nr:hypothetical protein [Pseudomonadota bacterium]
MTQIRIALLVQALVFLSIETIGCYRTAPLDPNKDKNADTNFNSDKDAGNENDAESSTDSESDTEDESSIDDKDTSDTEDTENDDESYSCIYDCIPPWQSCGERWGYIHDDMTCPNNQRCCENYKGRISWSCMICK